MSKPPPLKRFMEDGLPVNVRCGRTTPVEDAETGEVFVELVQEIHDGTPRVRVRHPSGRRLKMGKSRRKA